MALMGPWGELGKMCASQVGWLLSTSVQGDSVLPMLVTWHAMFNLTTLASWALEILASKQNRNSYFTCHSLPCNSFM